MYLMRSMGFSSLTDNTVSLCLPDGDSSCGNADSHRYRNFPSFTSEDCTTGTRVPLLLRLNADMSLSWYFKKALQFKLLKEEKTKLFCGSRTRQWLTLARGLHSHG